MARDNKGWHAKWKGPGVKMTPAKNRAQKDREAAEKRQKEAERQRNRRRRG